MRVIGHSDPDAFRKFIFRDQADRKDQRITRNDLSRAGNRLHPVIHIHNLNSFQSVFSDRPRDCFRQKHRNIEILHALGDISLQTSGPVPCFINTKYFRTFQTQASCHDQTDVTAPENDSFFCRHPSFQIDKVLNGPCCIDSGRTITLDKYLSGCALTASGRQDQRLCPYRVKPAAHG